MTRVEVVGYDPAWPHIAGDWLRRIRSALAGFDRSGANTYDHNGSTAVPGLAAKPIIDLQVCVERLPEPPSLCDALAPLDLRLAAGARLDSPGVRADVPRPGADPDPAKHAKLLFHRAAMGDGRAVILHVRRLDSPFAAFVVGFRDWLRASDEHAREYEVLKRHLAKRHADDDDYDDYTRAKSGFMDMAQQHMQDQRDHPLRVADGPPGY